MKLGNFARQLVSKLTDPEHLQRLKEHLIELEHEKQSRSIAADVTEKEEQDFEAPHVQNASQPELSGPEGMAKVNKVSTLTEPPPVLSVKSPSEKESRNLPSRQSRQSRNHKSSEDSFNLELTQRLKK